VQTFTHVGNACRVIFGAGRILADEISHLDAQRVIFCCTPRRKERVTQLAETSGNHKVKVIPIANSIVTEGLVIEGRGQAGEFDADCLVAFGGGSALGLAKSIALELDIPIIAIPTTYSGSETSELQGMFENGNRVLKRSSRMQPKTIIYDPELSIDLPLEISIRSAVNSMAHAACSFLGKNPNPLTSLIAEEGIRAMKSALPCIVDNPLDTDARGDALYGAWLCGSTLNSAGTVLHHKICHVLGGYFGVPHATAHTIIFPHSIGYNRDVAPEAMKQIARAFGDEDADAAGQIFDLLTRIGAPTALKDVGVSKGDLSGAAKLITTDPYFNPRPVEYESTCELLEDAWFGRRPTSS
jgi:maleylacetate reductase